MTLMQNLTPGGDMPVGALVAATFDPTGTPLDRSLTREKITKAVLEFSREIHVDANQPEIAGLRYQSYANAVTYIQGITTPSYFNRFSVVIHSDITVATPTLHPWIYPTGRDGKIPLVTVGNWTNVGSEGNAEAYMMFNLSTGGVDPQAGTIVQVWDSILNDQETTTKTGTIWLKRSNMFDGDTNADLGTCTLIIDDISQATITNGGSIICYGPYYLTVTGTTIAFLQTYGAGGQIYFDNDVTINGGYIFGAELYGVDFTALSLLDVDLLIESVSGGQLKRLITSATPVPSLVSTRTLTLTADSEILNTIIYDLDIVIDTDNLKTTGCMLGLQTETISEINGGIWLNKGDIFDDTSVPFTANNVQDAISQLTSVGSIILFGANNVSANTTDRFLYPGFANATAQTTRIEVLVPTAGTLRNMRVLQNIADGDGDPIVYTLEKNAIASILTVSIASDVEEGSDLINTVDVIAGDRISVIITKTLNVGNGPNDVIVTMELS